MNQSHEPVKHGIAKFGTYRDVGEQKKTESILVCISSP